MEQGLPYLAKVALAYVTAAIINNCYEIIDSYGEMFSIVIAIMIIDWLSGILKSKICGISVCKEKGWKGFWKKMAYILMICFSIFVDYTLPSMSSHYGYNFDMQIPIGSFAIVYVYINEGISILRNLKACEISVPKVLTDIFKNKSSDEKNN